MQNPARIIARVFIDVFGITRPTAKEEDRTTAFITVLLLLVVLFFLFAAYAFFHGFGR